MKLKEFCYENFESYLNKADQYDNPKQIKMFSVNTISGGIFEILAVTYLRTCLMGIQVTLPSRQAANEFTKSLIEHDHARGVILEVGKLS